MFDESFITSLLACFSFVGHQLCGNSVVLLAISYVVILYSATQFFHEKRFVCGAIYFVWVKHGFTTVDIFIVKAVTCVVLRTHIHCKKILCICQSQFLVCSVSKMKRGLLFFEETAGGQDIFSICCRHYSLFVTFLCPWKHENKLFPVWCCVLYGTSCMCVLMTSTVYNVPVDWYFLPWANFKINLTIWFACHEVYSFCWVNMTVLDTLSCRLNFF